MDLISSFFKRYANIEPPEKVIKEVVQEVLQGIFRVEINKDHISLANNKTTIFIEVTGPLKNEIFFRKKELLERINGKIPTKKKLTEIR